MAQPPGAFLRDLFGGFQHIGAAQRVHREHLNVQLHRGRDSFGHGVGDVVKLQIKEYWRPQLSKLPHHAGSCAGK